MPMDHVGTNSIFGFRGALFCTRSKNHLVDLDPHWVEPPYTHSMKTKIGGIESPMLGASYASKIITWKSPMWNTPGGLRRKIAKKGPKWLFLAILRP